MNRWKWYVTRYTGANGTEYLISDKEGAAVGKSGFQVQLDIWGEQPPTMPSGPLTEAGYFRWKADEADKGNHVQDLFNHGV